MTSRKKRTIKLLRADCSYIHHNMKDIEYINMLCGIVNTKLHDGTVITHEKLRELYLSYLWYKKKNKWISVLK